jgi:hypothetical protein
MSLTKMAYEQQYTDDSGIEYAFRYDAIKDTAKGVGVIEFESIDTVEFHQSQIDWLIECLQEIKEIQNI